MGLHYATKGITHVQNKPHKLFMLPCGKAQRMRLVLVCAALKIYPGGGALIRQSMSFIVKNNANLLSATI